MAPSLEQHLKTRPEFRDKAKAARLAYLYSDLSQARTNNPSSFTSSISWWSNVISDVVTKGLQDGGDEAADTSDKLVWHLDQDFVDRLRWDAAGRPTCLGTVAMQLSQSSPAQVIPLNHFMASVKPIDSFSWPRWLVSKAVGAPLWWSMGKLGIVDNESGMSEAKAWKLAQGDWVMVDALKKAAEAISAEVSATSSIIDRLYTLDSFSEAYNHKALAGNKLTSQDMTVLLKYLQRDRRNLVVDKDAIKILAPSEEAAAGITEAERGILQVKSTSSALESQISDLEARVAERQAKIATYIRSNQKDLALSHLRSKKALLDLLSKRTLAFENLHSVLLKIEAAESDVAILSAYQGATSSLKSLLAHPSLQKDNVENTMDALQDVLADQKEIEDIVTEGGKQASGLDSVDDEIQEELRQMQEEAEEEKRKKADEEKVKTAQAQPEAEKPSQVTGKTQVHQEAEELKDQLEQSERQREQLAA